MAGKKMLVVSAHPGDVLWRCSGAIGKHTQLGGTVIDGVCRDVPVIRQLNYPIFTKGRYVVTGKDRVYADRVQRTRIIHQRHTGTPWRSGCSR